MFMSYKSDRAVDKKAQAALDDEIRKTKKK